MTTLVLLEEEVGSGADNAEAVELLPFVDEAVALVDVSLLRLPVPIEFPSLIAAPIRLPMTWAIEATAPGVEEVMVFLAELVLIQNLLLGQIQIRKKKKKGQKPRILGRRFRKVGSAAKE